MKMRTFTEVMVSLFCLVMIWSLCGCATMKVDWDSRVGKVTFDELVVEIGPPDRQATLKDGTLVVEWVTRRAIHTTAYVGGYYYGANYFPYYSYAPPLPAYTSYSSPEYSLRLTFAPDGLLKSWKKLRR